MVHGVLIDSRQFPSGCLKPGCEFELLKAMQIAVCEIADLSHRGGTVESPAFQSIDKPRNSVAVILKRIYANLEFLGMGVLLADMPSDASNVRMGFEVGNGMFQEIFNEHHIAIQEIEIVTAAHLGMQVGHRHRMTV